MKKYIVILIVIIGLTLIRTKANIKTRNELLVCEVDVGSAIDLALENCILISGEVDWNEIGDYVVTYFDKQEEVYFDRLIKIVSTRDLEKGLEIYTSKLHCENEATYNTRDFLEISPGKYFLCGSVDYHEPIKLMEFIQEYAFLRYYENDTLVWEKIFPEYSYIVRIEKSSQGILCFMAYFEENQSDLKVLEINQSGKVLREKVISGNDYDYAEDMIVINNDIYLVASSYSTTGDIMTNYLDQRFIVLLSLDYLTLTIKNKINLGNSGYNLFRDLEYNNYLEKLTIVIEASGKEGILLTNSGGRDGVFLINLNMNLKMENYYHLNLYDQFTFLYVSGYNVFIATTSLDMKTIRGLLYTTDMRLMNSFTYSLDGKALDCRKLRQKDEKKFTIILNERSGGTLSYLGILNYVNTVEVLFNEASDYMVQFGYKTLDNNIYLIGGNDDEIIDVINYISIKGIKYNTYLAEFETYNAYAYQVNREEIFTTGNLRSGNVFGKYLEKYSYDLPYVSLIVSDKYYIQEKINIINDEIYDVGIKLTFNGDGYLNDDKIDNNFVVDKEGTYSLMVVGSNARKIINFTVKNLCVYSEEKEVPELEISDYKLEKRASVNDPIISTENNFVIIEDSSAIVFAVIIATVIIAITIFIPIKRRKL